MSDTPLEAIAGRYQAMRHDHDPGDEHDRRTHEILLSPLMNQRRMQDDEFSRGWNACAAAMRYLLETTR